MLTLSPSFLLAVPTATVDPRTAAAATATAAVVAADETTTRATKGRQVVVRTDTRRDTQKVATTTLEEEEEEATARPDHERERAVASNFATFLWGLHGRRVSFQNS